MSSKEFFWGIFGKNSESTELLKSPFKMCIEREKFCRIKTEILYEKILNRCYSRSQGATDEDKIRSLFDSAERSEAQRGLISLLADAMYYKKEVAIIYDSGVARVASYKEKQQIQADYEKNSKSTKGILVDFRKYDLTDLVIGYMSMIYDILTSMNTQTGLAKALQIKIHGLRGTVSLAGKDQPIEQAKQINESLIQGNSVLMDEKDNVEAMKLDSTSVESAMKLVYGQLAADIGMPLSFVNGELATGMSATGEADSNQQEEGLQDFFNSIFKPCCDKLYSWNLQFITDDWRWFSAMVGNLISVENSSLLTDEQKQSFADRLIPVTKK